jgi:hypothetical protein
VIKCHQKATQQATENSTVKADRSKMQIRVARPEEISVMKEERDHV